MSNKSVNVRLIKNAIFSYNLWNVKPLLWLTPVIDVFKCIWNMSCVFKLLNIFNNWIILELFINHNFLLPF